MVSSGILISSFAEYFVLKEHGPDYVHARGMPSVMPRNHLCGFQLASSSCFMAYPVDKTASTALSDSDNADRVDPGCLPSGMSSFLGHMHAYRSASLKHNMDLAYYCSNQSVEIAI